MTTPNTTPPVEQILCFHRTDIQKHIDLPKSGLIFNPIEAIKSAFAENQAFFTDRPAAEEDPSKKQLITYCVLRQGDKILRYTRGSKSGESRLVAKQSIGIGGHVNPIDQNHEHPTYETYLEAVKRELQEEVGITVDSVSAPVALINDDTNPVGQVHLGVVHVIDVSADQAQSAEEAIENLEEIPLAQLKAELDRLENWSALIVKSGILG